VIKDNKFNRNKIIFYLDNSNAQGQNPNTDYYAQQRNLYADNSTVAPFYQYQPGNNESYN